MRKRTWIILILFAVFFGTGVFRGYQDHTLACTEDSFAEYLAGEIYDRPVELIKTAEKDGWYAAMYRRSILGEAEDGTRVAIFKTLPFGRCSYEGMSGFQEPGVHRTGFWRKGGSECVVVAFGDNTAGTTQAYAFEADGIVYGTADVPHELILDIYDVQNGGGYPEFLLDHLALELLQA